MEDDTLKVTVSWVHEPGMYLGIWVNEGGWQGQYTVGIEPATGGMDSPRQGEQYDQAWSLKGHEVQKWQMSITLE